MQHYLINLDTTTVVGTFCSQEAAEWHTEKYTYNFTVVQDASDVETQLKRGEMVTIYNALTGSELKKFANKVEGARRTFEALQSHAKAPEGAPVASKPTAAKKPRSNGAVAAVWAIADALHAKGEATRTNVLEQAKADGINLNTTKTQWQHWRKANL